MVAKDGVLHLRIEQPADARGARELRLRDTLWIGRDTACDLVLSSPNVSRKHACLRLEASELSLEDHSANGTYVDDVHVQRSRRRLSPTSCIRIGQFELRLLSLSRAPASANEHSPADTSSIPTSPAEPEVPANLRRNIHQTLIEQMDLAKIDRANMDSVELRPRVQAALTRIVTALRDRLPPDTDEARLIAELCDEALGLGPLERLLSDAAVSEIMVVDPQSIFIERAGRIERTTLRFTDDHAVRAVIERIVTPLGRRIDESTPLVDARLKDGSRVNAIIPPLAIKGPCITIRKFPNRTLTIDDLIGYGSLDARMARFLVRSVRARKNILISGGTGSGKTTLLNVLSGAIPADERIVTIEDAAELVLGQPHVVSLESRPPNMEGKGAYTIRDLVRNALRMRPDRIVVGECRGGEALDMLQAMNTGHEGSMTTTHANSPREAIGRLETLCLMAGLDLPVQALRSQIAASVHLILQQTRFQDGSRRIVSVTEVTGLDRAGSVTLRELFRFRRVHAADTDKVEGTYQATGYMPSFAGELVAQGLVEDGEIL